MPTRYCRTPARVTCLVLAVALLTDALQAATKKPQLQQQQSGLNWAMQATTALTGGISVNTVSLAGSVVVVSDGNQEPGTISLQSAGIMTSSLTISTSAGTLSESRLWDGFLPSGQWTGVDGQPHTMAQQNCWTDGVWFFPALSLLSDYNDASMVFVDLGQQQYNGDLVEHIQAYRWPINMPPEFQQQIQQLSTVDFYLDSQTALPVGLGFLRFGDNNVNVAVPTTVTFSQYQSVNGVQVPSQVVRTLNGSASMQINVTSVGLNGQPPARPR
jgi:hypothetical protein